MKSLGYCNDQFPLRLLNSLIRKKNLSLHFHYVLLELLPCDLHFHTISWNNKKINGSISSPSSLTHGTLRFKASLLWNSISNNFNDFPSQKPMINSLLFDISEMLVVLTLMTAFHLHDLIFNILSFFFPSDTHLVQSYFGCPNCSLE